jgi:hypothetical protein
MLCRGISSITTTNKSQLFWLGTKRAQAAIRRGIANHISPKYTLGTLQMFQNRDISHKVIMDANAGNSKYISTYAGF